VAWFRDCWLRLRTHEWGPYVRRLELDPPHGEPVGWKFCLRCHAVRYFYLD
jgi:hypothetical protein